MKKMKFESNELLKKVDLKTILGGNDPEEGSGPCLVTCKSGSSTNIPNCDGAPDGACKDTGWSICTCN